MDIARLLGYPGITAADLDTLRGDNILTLKALSETTNGRLFQLGLASKVCVCVPR